MSHKNKQTKKQAGNERLDRYIRENLGKIKKVAKDGVKHGAGAASVVFREKTSTMLCAYVTDETAAKIADAIGMTKEYKFMRSVFDPVGVITVIGLLETPGGTEFYCVTQVKL